MWGKKGEKNLTYQCSCDTNAISFTGAATSADVSHNFPLANILLTRVMSKRSHILIIFLLLESLSSLGFCASPLLLSIYKSLASLSQPPLMVPSLPLTSLYISKSPRLGLDSPLQHLPQMKKKKIKFLQEPG